MTSKPKYKPKPLSAMSQAELSAQHFEPVEAGDYNNGPSNDDWLTYIAFVRAAWATLAMNDTQMTENGRGLPNGADDVMQLVEDFNATRRKLESALEFLRAGALRCMVVAARLDLERRASS